MFKTAKTLGVIFALSSVFIGSAYAAPKRKAPTPRDVEVDNVKEAYWNRTSKGEIEVVQNRQYAKENRLSLLAGVGSVSSDPFLSIQSIGGALSYHFSESFALAGIYKKFIVSDSSYLNELRTGLTTSTPSRANTNRPNSFIGGEIEWSPIYGKISLAGSSIVHYDAHFLLGAGMTDTESGKYFTPSVGFGPQFYLSNTFALRFDYRLAIYKESIRNTITTSPAIAGDRTNYSHQIAFGVEVFL
jgi:outer membrane beta-barrel protein